MKNKFAIFIKSHQRANNQLTYETLRRTGYTGDIYIIVDDEDNQLEKYKELYGDIVKVFNKDEMIELTDTVDNFHNKKNALLPATYCKLLAEQLNLDYYMIIDDDIEDIKERYVVNGSLKGRNVTKLDDILKLFINYMENTNISVLSFGNQGGYIGGANGKYKNGMGRCNCANFLIKTSSNIKFLGTRNEDFNMVASYSNIGELIFEIYRICLATSARGANEGGLHDDYANIGFYIANFYSIIVAPYCCKIGVKNNDFILKRNWDAFGPKVISEVYKK